MEEVLGKKYLRRDYKEQNNMKVIFFCGTRKLMDTIYSIV